MGQVGHSARLEALRALDVLDTTREPEFDRLAELAASICQVPMAGITLIDDRRQWFKSIFGLEMVELDLTLSFCTYTIERGAPLVVSDAREDARFARSPLVLGEPHIRFYACVPLTTSEGFRVGTLVVVDQQPRELTAQQLSALETLAGQAVLLMEFRRQRREMKAQQALQQEALRESALRGQILAIQQEISTAQLPLDAVCSLMAERAMAVLPATGVEIELLEGNDLVSHGYFGETHRALGARMPVRSSIAGRVVSTGEPQYCADSETDPRVNRRICREVGVRSMLLVPLRNSGRVVGILRATAREPHAFSHDQTTSLLLLSESLGAVIERIRFSEALRQSEFQYRLLFEHNPHPMWVYERASLRIVAANRSAQIHYGYSEEEFQQLEVPDLWPAEAARNAKEQLHAIPADAQTVGALRQHLKRN